MNYRHPPGNWTFPADTSSAAFFPDYGGAYDEQPAAPGVPAQYGGNGPGSDHTYAYGYGYGYGHDYGGNGHDGYSMATLDAAAPSFGDDDPLFGALPGTAPGTTYGAAGFTFPETPAAGYIPGTYDAYAAEPVHGGYGEYTGYGEHGSHGGHVPYQSYGTYAANGAWAGTGYPLIADIPAQPGPEQAHYGYDFGPPAGAPWDGGGTWDDGGAWATGPWLQAEHSGGWAYDNTGYADHPGYADHFGHPGHLDHTGYGYASAAPYDATAPGYEHQPNEQYGHQSYEQHVQYEQQVQYEQYGHEPAPAVETTAAFPAFDGYGGCSAYYDVSDGYDVPNEAPALDADLAGGRARDRDRVSGREDGPLRGAGPGHGPRPATRSRTRSRPKPRRSAVLTVAVPSVCVLGVASAAAASFMGASKDEATTQAGQDDGRSVRPSSAKADDKLDKQIAGASAADEFAGRASRTQERLDLKKRQEAEKARKAKEAARKEAMRPKFMLPVKEHGLSAQFGQSGANWMSIHTGIDFPVSEGTPVRAVTDGTISTKFNPSFGNMAIVTAKDGTETRYCHLSSTKIRSGKVKAGETIGYSGSSGNSTGPHLHFEVRPGGGKAIDPLPWLQKKGLNPN